MMDKNMLQDTAGQPEIYTRTGLKSDKFGHGLPG